ncbi:glutamine synthetase [Candidatus Peregrinibacteria bacterium]|nr:glutamine synthetase [Candidatus Peregrinibacteria bacterium]
MKSTDALPFNGDSLPKKTPRFKEHPNYLELSYEELRERNLKIKHGEIKEEAIKEKLKEEKRIKSVIVCFSDMEGRFHMLDFAPGHVLESEDNLTFDGSSIKGFSAQNKSDLRLKIDWKSFRWVPADVFGAGKVIVFANVHDQDDSPYLGDFRSNLKLLLDELKGGHELTVNVAPEVEGFLVEGEYAEQDFEEEKGFKPASKTGYFSCLPQDRLRRFIDLVAEATSAMGFENEKDHPEVAPGQFELSYKYADALYAADQIQLYKIVARQIANFMGCTATFLPKPIRGINGSGMHVNLSMSKEGKNIFYDEKGQFHLSEFAHRFIDGVLFHAKATSLIDASSINAYRRYDPKFEAPNAIKVSDSDRGAMIRVPLGNEKSARIEKRTVAPDTNPYLMLFATIRAGLSSVFGTPEQQAEFAKAREGEIEKLPTTLKEAVDLFEQSEFIKEILTGRNRDKFLELKKRTRDRSPKDLGDNVHKVEVREHHEVGDQSTPLDF